MSLYKIYKKLINEKNSYVLKNSKHWIAIKDFKANTNGIFLIDIKNKTALELTDDNSIKLDYVKPLQSNVVDYSEWKKWL